MKIAVTGASGFIGRYVLSELKKRQVEIIAITTNKNKFLDYSKGIDRIIEYDIGNADGDVFEALGRPDVLIHLAWAGLPNYKSLAHINIELPKQFAFIRHLTEGGLNSFLITGTCFEYGMLSGPIPSDSITRPVTCYGFAKDVLRKQIEFLAKEREFDFTWARLFYLYGEHQSSASLFSQISEAVKRGDSTFKMSGGEQLRDYLRVEEAAVKLVDLALAPGSIITNLCSGRPISVRSLVELWIRTYGWNINLELGAYPYPDYEPMAFWGA